MFASAQQQTAGAESISSVITPPPMDPAAHSSESKPRRPSVNIDAPAINATPVELDSTPVSPVAHRQGTWPATRARPGHDASAAGDHDPQASPEVSRA